MPKKTRKAKVRASQRAVSTGYMPAARTIEPSDEEFTQPAPTRVAAPVTTRPMPSSSARAVAPIVTDYSYVFRDLRRIAVLAAVFFVIMFVLYFVIEVQHIPIIPGVL